MAQLHPGRPGPGPAPFDITIQNQHGDVEQVDFDGKLNAAGFNTAQKLSWQRDFLVYYGDTAVTGLYSSGVIGLTDYNALRERQGEGPYTGACPPPSPGRRYAAGEQRPGHGHGGGGRRRAV